MKCLITAAGLGTRLIPLTKIIPKEMLPIYDRGIDQNLILKPILQVIFESLYDYKIRDYCFIVGKTKKAVEKHFKSDLSLVKNLQKERKNHHLNELLNFEKKLECSEITFKTQSNQEGFGNAIELGENFVKKDAFLLHAGDDIVISKNNNHLKKLEKNFRKFNADIAFLIEEVNDPSQYGVVEGNLIEKNIIEVKKIKEKPKKPKSNYAIVGIYLFKSKIFQYLNEAKKPNQNERQLDRAFQIALKNKDKIIGVILAKNEKRMDIGTPATYAKILKSLKT